MEIEPKIIIDVKKILASDVGESDEFNINEEIANIDEIQITKPIVGKINITNVSESLIADISIHTAVRLVCSRCAKDFSHNILLSYKQNYRSEHDSDEFPILADNKIDIWPSIRQEILLSVPIQPLCDEKCKGIKYK